MSESSSETSEQPSETPVEVPASSSTSSVSSAVPQPSAQASSVVPSDASSAVPDYCLPDAVRILVSVASLTDMAVLPTQSPGDRQLYRTNTVSIISRSEAHMNLVLEKILEDLQSNATIQGLPNVPFEIVVTKDAVPGSTQDQVFPTR